MKPADQAAAEQAREVFEALGPLSVRPMFGGAGLYRDGLFFGLIADGDIYLKTDAAFAQVLEAEGGTRFAWTNPKTGKEVRMGFHTLPSAAFDDSDLAREWGRRALAVAKAAALEKDRKASRGS